MRKINVLHTILFVLFFISCSEDEKQSKEEKFLNKLSGTWTVESVMLDTEEVTDEFEEMKITFDTDGTYTTQNPVGNIWAASGMFDVVEGSGDLYNLQREDDMLVNVTELSESTLIFTMQFSAAPGKAFDLSGSYTFEMRK